MYEILCDYRYKRVLSCAATDDDIQMYELRFNLAADTRSSRRCAMSASPPNCYCTWRKCSVLWSVFACLKNFFFCKLVPKILMKFKKKEMFLILFMVASHFSSNTYVLTMIFFHRLSFLLVVQRLCLADNRWLVEGLYLYC